MLVFRMHWRQFFCASKVERKRQKLFGQLTPFIQIMLNLASLFLLAFSASIFAASSDPESVKALFINRCGTCHGGASPGLGGLDHIENLASLVETRRIRPADALGSPLFLRVSGDSVGSQMPLGAPPLTVDELGLLQAWIEAGAPESNVALPKEILPLDFAVAFSAALADATRMASSDPGQATGLRYLLLPPQGIKDQSSGQVIADKSWQAVTSWVINSLSSEPEISQLLSPGAQSRILRLDIAAFGWSAAQWETLMQEEPYFNGFPAEDSPLGKDMESLRELTGTRRPLARLDWLLKNAVLPANYRALLNLPDTEKGLESLLGVDVARSYANTNSQRRLLLRSGFRNSGVSKFNRVIDRVKSSAGFYWKSYDFAADGPSKNIFSRPLGPRELGVVGSSGEELGFDNDGGEIIFSLPNGLQAYYLSNAAGRIIDKGPANVVFHRERGEEVLLGFSCMTCHAQGLVIKADEVRDTFLGDSSLSSEAVKAEIDRLYPQTEQSLAALQSDRAGYLLAKRRAAPALATLSNDQDLLGALKDVYDAPLNLLLAASEMGLGRGALVKCLNRLQRVRANEFPSGLQLLSSDQTTRASFEKEVSTLTEACLTGTGTETRSFRILAPDLRLSIPERLGAAQAHLSYEFELPENGRLSTFKIALTIQQNLALRNTGPCTMHAELFASSSAQTVPVLRAAVADACPQSGHWVWPIGAMAKDVQQALGADFGDRLKLKLWIAQQPNSSDRQDFWLRIADMSGEIL